MSISTLIDRMLPECLGQIQPDTGIYGEESNREEG